MFLKTQIEKRGKIIVSIISCLTCVHFVGFA